MPFKSPHTYYVYNDGDKVMARMGDRAAVVAKVCADLVTTEVVDGKDVKKVTPAAQVAHDEVQKIVNPTGIRHDDPRLEVPLPDHPDPKKRNAKGFHHPAFTEQISANCEAFVKAAYAKK